MMKKLALVWFVVSAGVLFAQINVDTDALRQQATGAEQQAFQRTRDEFKRRIADIPFEYNSAVLPLNDPKYTVMGHNVDTFMKQVLIPALSQVVNALPTGRRVVIEGHANAIGPEQPQNGRRGNIALSRARAEAVLDYILKNSQLARDRFVIRAAGSSKPLPGTDPRDDKNRRVSLDIE